MMAIYKKTAIVTGGAGGIGAEFAKRLLQRGYRVVLADLNTQLGTDLQGELGEDVLFVYCDVANWESQAAMFKKACQWGGHIDLFIANAGIEEQEHFYQIPDKGGEPVKPNTAVIDVNLYSVVYGLRLFRHYNRESKKKGEFSRMLVTTSLAGVYPFPAAPIYSAAKNGVSHSYFHFKLYMLTLSQCSS
jgi:15-hydroxyprostaglandin dehydrogenase (NAD)